MANELSKNIFDLTSDRLKHFLSIQDRVLENEFVMLAGDVSKVVKFIKGANELVINKKFNAFLNGFTESEMPTEQQMERLLIYIDNESKAEFISDTFTKVLLSNSSKSCLVMGTLLKSMVNDGGKLDHEKLVCLSALKDFFDVDLVNYVALYDYYDWCHPKKISLGMVEAKKVFYLAKLGRFAKERGLNLSSIMLTLEKAINSQLINRYLESNIEVDYDSDIGMTDVSNKTIEEYYTVSSPGELLYKFIKRIS